MTKAMSDERRTQIAAILGESYPEIAARPSAISMLLAIGRELLDEAERARKRETTLVESNWKWLEDARLNLQRAEAAEAKLAEVGEPELEWGVRDVLHAADGPQDIKHRSEEQARFWFESGGSGVLICRTKAGPWRVAEQEG